MTLHADVRIVTNAMRTDHYY